MYPLGATFFRSVSVASGFYLICKITARHSSGAQQGDVFFKEFEDLLLNIKTRVGAPRRRLGTTDPVRLGHRREACSDKRPRGVQLRVARVSKRSYGSPLWAFLWVEEQGEGRRQAEGRKPRFLPADFCTRCLDLTFTVAPILVRAAIDGPS